MLSTFIELNQMPDWAKMILASLKMKPSSIKVIAGQNVQVGGTGDDRDKITLFVHNGNGTRVIAGTFGGLNPFANRAESAVNAGFEAKLSTINEMILEVHTYPKIAKLYVHPESLPKQIASDVDMPTRHEMIVLIATRSFKSSYAGDGLFRFTEAKRETGITWPEWDAAVTNCKAKGWLDARGAIKAAGKCHAQSKQLYAFRQAEQA